MPQFGQGMVPSGAIANELTAITRRAFMPFLTVQIYSSTPTLSLLLRNAQRAKGGMSQITAPVQGQPFVTSSWTDYSGTFSQPAVQTGVQNAEFNLTLNVCPIPFLGIEGLVQSSEAVVPLLKARMADAKTVMVQQMSSALFSNNQNSPLVMNGLPQAYDDGTNVATYGGINRTVAANAFWKGQLVTSAGAVLTRNKFIVYLLQATKNAGGESPDFGIMSFSDWTALMQDFSTAEQFVTAPGSRYSKDTPVNAGFRALMLGDTPIFPDPFCPKGTAYFGNSKYLAMYLSEDAPFAFSGFYSTIPNLQIGNVGVVLTALQTVCTKPVSGIQITGITGGAF
jgi:hypothetical protein